MFNQKFSSLRESDSALSPVVGVVLIVAITVVLSGIVAVAVFGIGLPGDGSTGQQSGAVQVNELSGGEMEVTLVTETDGELVVEGPSGASYSGGDGADNNKLTEVGQTVVVSGLQDGDSISIVSGDGDAVVQSTTYSPSTSDDGTPSDPSVSSSGTVSPSAS
jgi:flagellin-like protein